MPFQFIEDSTNDLYGSKIGYSCSSKVANLALVQHFSMNVVPGTICGDPTQKESISTIKNREAAPLVVETNTSDREGVREVFLSQGFDNDTVHILMSRNLHLVTRFHQLNCQLRLH